MRARLILVLLALFALRPLPEAGAQTWTPKQIRFQGPGDAAELLKLTGLTPGAAVSKAQIDAALQKLADTGAFNDLSYTVDSDALVFRLGGSAESGQALPVRYVNLVWWSSDELTRLLKARVPLFQGELPLSGTLTDQVRTAVLQLLADKGIANARVEASPSGVGTRSSGHRPAAGANGGLGAIGLRVTQPEVLLGKVTLTGEAPPAGPQLAKVLAVLSGQEFESDVSGTEIVENVADTHHNAGFLDATVDPPVFSPPRKDMLGYAIDASATVHPGELYRIGPLTVATVPPLTQADAAAAVEIKTGDPAGAMAVRIAVGRLQAGYRQRGYLDALVNAQTALDASARTLAVQMQVTPGALYHLASVDTTALPPDVQAGFAREFHGRSGMDAGAPLNQAVASALRSAHAETGVRIEERKDAGQHLVTLVLIPKPGPPVEKR